MNIIAGTIYAGMARRSAEDPERDLLFVGALAGTGPGAGWRIGPDEIAANQLVAYGGGNTQGPINVSTSLTAHGTRQDFESETFVAHKSPLPFDTTQITSAANRSSPKVGDTGHPLSATAHPPAIAFDTYNQAVTGEITQTLCSRGETPGGNSHLVPAIAFNARQDPISGPISGPIDTDGSTNAIAFQERGREGGRTLEVGGDVSYALTAPSGGGRSQELNIAHGWAVRRLMPLECERLMAFPDDYTAITFRGKPASDGVRYKALGNSWATNCARWISRRIDMVDAITRSAAA